MIILKLATYFLSLHYWNSRPAASIKKMQLKKFREIFEYARCHSKFYRQYYGDHGVLDLKIERFADIEKVPLTNKSMLRQFGTRDTMTREMGKRIHVHSTSGSTGEPFKIAFNKFEDYSAHIRLIKALMEHGYRPWKKMVLLSRYETDHQFEIEGDLGVLGWLQRKLGLFKREVISIFEPVDVIVKKLQALKPDVLWSTPSIIEVISLALKKNDEKLDIPLVLFMSETISPDQIVLFNERIGKYFIDLYGCMESPSIAFGFNQIDAKKIFSNSTLVEVIRHRHMEDQLVGDIIITNLVNRTMPLIRYDLGDYAEVLDLESFPGQRLGKIFGRYDDIVYFGGKYTLTYHQTFQLFRDFHACERYKFIQKTSGDIVLQLKVSGDADKNQVKDLALQRWGEKYPDFPLSIEWRDSFAIDGKTGKFKVIEKMAG